MRETARFLTLTGDNALDPLGLTEVLDKSAGPGRQPLDVLSLLALGNIWGGEFIGNAWRQ